MSSQRLELFVPETKDEIARENFDRIREFVSNDLFTKFDGEHFTVDIPAAITNLRYEHRLGFKPQDVILTSKIGAGSVTFNYNLFTNQFIDITTTGAATIRFVAGTFVIDR